MSILNRVVLYFTRDLTWKKVLMLISMVIAIIGASFGLYWLALALMGAPPGILEEIEKVRVKQRKEREKIVVLFDDIARETRKDHAAEEESERKREREKEKANEKLPSIDSADKIAHKIMEGIDDAGRD